MNSMISNGVPIAEGRRYAIGSAQGKPFVGFFGDRCFHANHIAILLSLPLVGGLE
jgi:hypothetical protein